MTPTRRAQGSTRKGPRHELADIVRAHKASVGPISSAQSKVLCDVERCRTSALGGHIESCSACDYQRNAYNSCRNRHCPKCQSLARHRWVERRKERLLPTHYFHVVFTLPAELRALARKAPVAIFDLLFSAATETLQALAADKKHLGAQLGITAILHTWTRELAFHPHLHCVVTGGGLTADGKSWKGTSPGYLFPVKTLGALFCGKFLAGLKSLADDDSCDDVTWSELGPLLDQLYSKSWVVYAKEPFGSAEHVFRYLGRYTHRIAISNHRILKLDGGTVTFATRHGQKKTLPARSFLKRFLQHVVPQKYVRIRHYGLCAPANVHSRLKLARELLEQKEDVTPRRLRETPEQDFRALLADVTGVDLRICPVCSCASMQRTALPRTRAPPA